MKWINPEKVVSGFHSERPDPAVPQLIHVGEQWAAHDYVVPRHSHGVWEFYLQLHGKSVWKDQDGATYVCGPGAFYAPPPGLEHWLHRTSHPKHHFYFAGIDVNAVVQARWPDLLGLWGDRKTVHFSQGEALREQFARLVAETLTDQPLRTQGLRCAMEGLIIDVSRLIRMRGHLSTRRFVPIHDAVDRARRAIDTHPGEPWRLTELGRLTGLSPNHLAALFTRQLGQSPRQYLLTRRLEQARILLRTTDEQITTIAHALGFHSSQHFARAFRAATGRSATAFRRRRTNG